MTMSSKQKNSLKKQLVAIFGCRCWWCRREQSLEDLTLDHLIPKSKGGSNSSENLRLACRSCNQARGNSLYPPNHFSLQVKNSTKNRSSKHCHPSHKVNKDPKFVDPKTTLGQ